MHAPTPKYSDQRASLSYRPDIDGLRALAVLGVLVYHAGFGLPGGFVGVDIFFVISGYLITQGILRELDAGHFSLRAFWERRVRRILPASLVTIGAALVAGYFLLLPSDYEELAQGACAQLFFLGNIFYWSKTGYFAGPAELKPLLHTWSLAVEEQFYLGLPVLLAFLCRWGRQRAWIGLLGLALISWLACALLTPRMPSASFYLLPTRAWELLAGSLLAFSPSASTSSPSQPGTWKGQLAAVAALSGLIFTMLFFQADAHFPGTAATLPVGCTALLIHLHRDRSTFVSHLLSHAWLVGVGLISYSLYLWHWPLFAFTRYVFHHPPPALMLLPFMASFPIALASWRWIECPLRRRVDTQGVQLFAVAGLALLVPLLAALLVWNQRGVPQRFASQGVRPPPPVETLSERYATSPVDFQLDELPILGVRRAEPRFLVWGDSHALALAPAIDKIATELGQTGILLARGGTPPLAGAWRQDASAADRDRTLRWNANALRAIRSRQWDAILVIAAWQVYIHETGLQDAESLEDDQRGTAYVLARKLQQTMQQIDTSPRVYWLPPAPRQTSDLAQAARNHALYGWEPAPDAGLTLADYDLQLAEIEAAFQATKAERHQWLDIRSQCFDAEGRGVLYTEDEFCYVDDNHVSEAGARRYFGELLRSLLEFP